MAAQNSSHSLLLKKWAIPDKKQTGGVEDMEFPGGIEEIARGISRG